MLSSDDSLLLSTSHNAVKVSKENCLQRLKRWTSRIVPDLTLRLWHHGALKTSCEKAAASSRRASDELKDMVTNESVGLRLFLASTGYWKKFIISREIHGGQIESMKLFFLQSVMCMCFVAQIRTSSLSFLLSCIFFLLEKAVLEWFPRWTSFLKVRYPSCSQIEPGYHGSVKQVQPSCLRKSCETLQF